MPVISLFTFDKPLDMQNLCKNLNGKKSNDFWITAMASKYNKEEIFVQYWYYEDIDDSIRQVFEEDDAYEVVSFLKQNGKNKVLKRVYVFVNIKNKTLEVYRGPDKKTEEIIKKISGYLKIKFTPLQLKSHEMERMLSHISELRTAVFRNVHGLKVEIMKADALQENLKFKHHMKYFRNCFRGMTFRPKIKFLNNNNKYHVYLDGDRGTLYLSENEVFRWRPRFEIRQIVQKIAECNGLISS